MSELGYTIFGQPFLGSGDNAGFLYVKPSFQVGIKGLGISKVHLARVLLRSNLKWTTGSNMLTSDSIFVHLSVSYLFCIHLVSVRVPILVLYAFLNVHVFFVRLLLSR